MNNTEPRDIGLTIWLTTVWFTYQNEPNLKYLVAAVEMGVFIYILAGWNPD